MHRVLLDTDVAMGVPGANVDDGLALAVAVADPGLRLELVTTVAGNTDVDTATALAGDLLARLGRPDVPVVRGAAAALGGATAGADGVRADGRPGAPDEAAPDEAAAVEAAAVDVAAVEIAERVLAAPGELTVVTIGPLTNLALALRRDPRVATALARVVVMGGAYLGTAARPDRPAETNFWSDPEAAAVVLASGAPLRLVGLDVTAQVRLARADADRLVAGPRPFGRYAGSCTRAYLDALGVRGHGGAVRDGGSLALHDPLAVAVVSHPGLVTWRRAHVRVETGGDLTRGVALAAFEAPGGAPPLPGGGGPGPSAGSRPTCEVAVDVDAAAAAALVLECLAAA